MARLRTSITTALIATTIWCHAFAVADPPAEDATQIRIRELIYVLRQHRAFERCDEWGSAIRELATIGRPALPELLRELEQTERNHTLRGLLFTLRAIDDPRAIPFLMDALPKAERLSNTFSDYGLAFTDPALRQFMKQHQNYPRSDEDAISYGRPTNEILSTVHKLTRTAPPDLTKRLDPTWRAAYWFEWWKAKQQSGDAPQKDESLALAPRNEDLVDRDGVRKFGPLFPTGKGNYLSPVASVTLEDIYTADAPSAIDFESGRLFEHREGLRFGPRDSQDWRDLAKWRISNGIDLSSTGGSHDLHLWLINNDRWDTLDSEIRSANPFDFGSESYLLRPVVNNPDGSRIGTYLFTTREGARGVLRVVRTPNDARDKYEYRLWNRKTNSVAVRPPPPPGEPNEWQAKRIAIVKEPGWGNQCLFDFETGKSEALIYASFRAQPASDIDARIKVGIIFTHEAVAEWARTRGIDLVTYRYLQALEKGLLAEPAQPILGLTILDARTFRVSAKAFESLSLAHANEILARDPQSFRLANLSPLKDSPTTYLFETKSGSIGLITILRAPADSSSVSFQYKLANVPNKN